MRTIKHLFVVVVFLAACGGSSGPSGLIDDAEAATQIDVVAATGPHGFDCQQTFKMFRDSLYAYEAIGIKIKIKNEICRVNPWPTNFGNKLTNWFKWSKELRARKRKTIVITDPLDGQDGKRYIGGLGSYPMQLAIVYAQPVNQDGVDRYYMSMVASQHESAHTKGAEHDDTPDQIMHPAALAYTLTNTNLMFSEKTIKEFKQWKKRKNKYKYGRRVHLDILNAVE